MDDPTTPDAVAAPQVRLALAAHPGGSAFDGAWWPHNHDLAELTALVNALRSRVGEIHRISLNPQAWISGAASVRSRLDNGARLTIDWFPRLGPDVVSLRQGAGAPLRLQIIPPATGPERAQELMAAAGAS